MRRFVLRAVGGTAVVTTGAVLYHVAGTSNVGEAASGTLRFARAASTLVPIGLDYKFTLDRAEKANGGDKGSEGYKKVRAEVDLRSAQSFLKLCNTLGGVWVKTGQYISTLNASLPREWTETLATLTDRAASVPFADVAAILREDLGVEPQAVFASISEQPVASASLAQVHKAVLHSGEEVAVKLQYPRLRVQAAQDARALHVFATLVAFFFPDFDYKWLLPELTQSLQAELNFLQEAHNGERVAAQFAGRKHLHVPRVFHHLTTERMLTSEWIDGLSLREVDGIRDNLKIDLQQLAQELLTFSAAQIYLHGLVHADPHAGNLMARRHPVTRDWQLVVLDHGMYRALTPHFRQNYSQLWKALILRDDEAGMRAATALGVREEDFVGLALILAHRVPGSKATLGGKLSTEDVQKLKDRFRGTTAADINAFMQTLPRDLLFVMRAGNMIRSLNLSLGGSTKDRFRVWGEHAIAGAMLTEQYREVRGLAAKEKDGSKDGDGAQEEAGSTFVTDVHGSVAETVVSHPAAKVGRSLTYDTALSVGAVASKPTESEVVASAGAAVTSAVRHPWRFLRLHTELLNLRVQLWIADLILAYLMRRGEFQVYDAKKDGHHHREVKDLG